MSEKSPSSVPRPRFSNGPSSRIQESNHRQPLYLAPNSPFLSPRTGRTPGPRNRASDNPEFIPLGISSPMFRPRQRQSWNRSSVSTNTSYSTSSSPPSFNSNHGYSPYKKHNSRGDFRGRGRRNYSANSTSESPPIHLYYDKEALENPWAELEKKLEGKQRAGDENNAIDGKKSALLESSGSDVSDYDNDES